MKLMNSYVYIPVSDLYTAAEWYSKYLGFKIVVEDSIYLEIRTESGVRVMLIPNEGKVTSHMNYSTGTQASYGFIVSDINMIYEKFEEEGIIVDKMTEYQGKSFKFHDPDGNRIELWSDYE